MQKYRRVALAAALAGALALPASASADPTKTCFEEGKNKNFTNTVEQTSACPSASDKNQETVAVTNKGGNQPGGQQP
jgi:ABC-type oligopeptide transport system substrate-binding subunit